MFVLIGLPGNEGPVGPKGHQGDIGIFPKAISFWMNSKKMYCAFFFLNRDRCTRCYRTEGNALNKAPFFTISNVKLCFCVYF